MRVLSLALILLVALAPSVPAQAPSPCEIRGHLTIPEVHVTRASGRIALVTIEDRDVRVTPLGRGVFQVRTHGGERIEGRTEAPVPITLAADWTFVDVVTVTAGTRVDRIEPHASAYRGDLGLHEGVTLTSAELQCRDLGASVPTDAAVDTGSLPHGPRWRARVAHFRLRSTPEADARPASLELTPEARARVVWVERERREGWARIESALAHARISGWVRDTDLTLP